MHRRKFNPFKFNPESHGGRCRTVYAHLPVYITTHYRVFDDVSIVDLAVNRADGFSMASDFDNMSALLSNSERLTCSEELREDT